MASEFYPLFDAHPSLRGHLPRVPLASLPTPIERLSRLEASNPGAALWMKRDDLCSPVYGGNKTRKLELVLGAVERSGADRVLTFGYASSNHATATALFCRRRGIACVSMLLDEPPSAAARENLLVAAAAGAELHLYSGLGRLVVGAAVYRMAHPLGPGRLPPMIAAGGSTREGNAAFANAAFELRSQIEAGALPAPDEIWIAGGSFGSAAGLIAGLGAAGLASRVVVVDAAKAPRGGSARLSRMALKTARSLNIMDATYPRILSSTYELHAAGSRSSGGRTPETARAMGMLEEIEGIRLEPVYTGPAFARLLAAARAPRSRGKKLLFWNTANAVDLAPRASAVDPRAVPQRLRRFLETA